MNAIDTNVILYAHDPRDPVTRSMAAAIIEHVTDGVLLCAEDISGYPAINGLVLINPF